MGYMGHLTLISEDVIGALEHFPPDLRLQIAQYAPQPGWDEYVTTRYKETKRKDTSLLGGGKPAVAPGMRNGTSQWKVDEADTPKTREGEGGGEAVPGGEGEKDEDEEMEGMAGEFRRNVRTSREVSADFGAPMDDEEDEDFRAGPPPHVSISDFCILQPVLNACFEMNSLQAISHTSSSLGRITPRTKRRRTTKMIVVGWRTPPSSYGLHQYQSDSTRPIEGH